MEAVTIRVEADLERQARLAEAQAKVICTFIGANAGVWMDLKKGQKNPLVEAAQKIDFLGTGPTEEERELDRIRGPKVADDWKDDPRIAPQPANPETGEEASNPEGSMEAFMTMFGGQPMAPPPGVNGSG